MEKEILEKVLIKAVKYYFKGLSAKEAVNKALEEIKEQFGGMSNEVKRDIRIYQHFHFQSTFCQMTSI